MAFEPKKAQNRHNDRGDEKMNSEKYFKSLIGGEGGIRTHVGRLDPHPISSRRRCDRFGTSPEGILLELWAKELYILADTSVLPIPSEPFEG